MHTKVVAPFLVLLSLVPALAAQQPSESESAVQQWTTTLLAFTGFAHPDPAAIERNADGTVPSCRGRLVFFVYFRNAGDLHLAITRDEGALATKLVTTVAPHPEQSERPATTKSRTTTTDAPAQGETDTTPLGSFSIDRPGYAAISIATADGSPLTHLRALTLNGASARNAHAVTRERRNAASVHLGYPMPAAHENDVEWFLCEVTPRTDPLHTFYMATGWSRGYFGIQVNSATERRVIFSVWDAGNEAVDRSKVADENRVQLVAKGDAVIAESFGNEGTGGHSHLVLDWKLGTTFRFLVHANAQDTHTTYTGWFAPVGKDEWRLIASFRAPKDGKGLRGLHSFVENFVGDNGDLARDCEFGNVWARVRGGEWLPLREAKFSHDPQGRQQRLDRYAGLRGDRFYLHTGGFEEPPADGVIRRDDALRVSAPATTRPPSGDLPVPPTAASTK